MKKSRIINASTNHGERLYVIVSPEEMNTSLNTIIACPLVRTKRNIPTQIPIKSNVRSGLQNDCFIAIDQITTLHKNDVLAKVGEISESETERITMILQEMFAL